MLPLHLIHIHDASCAPRTKIICTLNFDAPNTTGALMDPCATEPGTTQDQNDT